MELKTLSTAPQLKKNEQTGGEKQVCKQGRLSASRLYYIMWSSYQLYWAYIDSVEFVRVRVASLYMVVFVGI